MGDGWVPVKDASGATYYWETATGATSWSAPNSKEGVQKNFEDTFECGSQFAGKLIGKKGSTLQDIQDATKTKISIPRDADKNPRMTITITGEKKGAVEKCKTVIRVMIGLSRTVEQALLEIDGKAINWAAVREANKDKQRWEQLNLSPEDMYAIQWLREFHKDDKDIIPIRASGGETDFGSRGLTGQGLKRVQDAPDPMNPANFSIVDDGKGNDGGAAAPAKRKKNQLIETILVGFMRR